MANTEKMTSEKWDWNIDLSAFVGRTCRLSTKDGTYREGKISAVKMTSLEVADHLVELPQAVELNGDLEDLVPFDRLTSLKVE
jgi:hypothetical protein